MSFLELRDLSKTFDDGTEAVAGIDLACEEGEFVVFLGPSGCGKTTTLRMVAGLETASTGQVNIAGRSVKHLGPSQRDIGFVFQFYALYPHMSVRENVAFPLHGAGFDRTARGEQVAEVLERLAISALASRYPSELSGGDQQRVALARALVRQPKLWLMDEPLGTLDAELRAEMRELIRAQQLEAGITTLYVTHDQEEAMSLADRIVVMERGHLRQVGPPASVYDKPEDVFVAHFIGSPGMNFIAGEILADDPTTLVVRDGTALAIGDGQRPGSVTMGVRPEFIRGTPSAGALPATVVTAATSIWIPQSDDSSCASTTPERGRTAIRAAPETG